MASNVFVPYGFLGDVHAKKQVTQQNSCILYGMASQLILLQAWIRKLHVVLEHHTVQLRASAFIEILIFCPQTHPV